MKKIQKIEALIIGGFAGLLSLGAVSRTISFGQPYYVLSVNDVEVGAISAATDVENLILQARRQVMQKTNRYAYVDAEVEVKTSAEKFQKLLTEDAMMQLLADKISDTMLKEKQQAYTITAGTYSANFASKAQAMDFLEQVKNRTEGGRDFSIVLDKSVGSKGVGKAEIINPKEQALLEEEQEAEFYTSAGITTTLMDTCDKALQMQAEDYRNQTGILAMDFADNIYGYENYADIDSFVDMSKEITEVTKEKETNTIYVVEAGDCLSIIAEKFDTTIESIVGLNELKNEEATVYLDQELIVAVPRPDISFKVSQGIVYEENYSAEPTIIPNDAWYTTQEVVHQEGTEGSREVNALVTYENGLEIERETMHTTVLAESVPAVVERGTKIPPTYIKPLSGGRFTSGYGRRWGRTHKGADWATPVGTPVYASSGGTVSVAGAVRGYGYAVYINHPDGRQTRYGHLSEVLVSPGQSVEQGQKIALSGNTGRSTGPHVHFEILVDGSQVNPLNYMN